MLKNLQALSFLSSLLEAMFGLVGSPGRRGPNEFWSSGEDRLTNSRHVVPAEEALIQVPSRGVGNASGS